MIKILANDGIDPIGEKLLVQAGYELVVKNYSQEALADEINQNGFKAVLVRSATKITREIIDKCPGIKLLGRAGVGVDNIDVAHAEKKGIAVVNTPDASSRSVAELVFAHLFGMCRFLHESNREMPLSGDTHFKELKSSFSKGIELKDKTLGIIGLGRIGKEVARMAYALGMHVIAYDRHLKGKQEMILQIHQHKVKFDVDVLSFPDLLQNADFITIHISTDKGERPLIRQKEFALMKKGVGIVNTSRGGVIDESDLMHAFQNGKVKFAGLDVFENEPTPGTKILMQPNVSITPHIGASTLEAQERIGEELARKVIDYFGRK
jgi:D-3-phosphoglycerate dehydrogenase